MKSSEKIRVMLLGPSLHAVSGVSTHINQLLNSPLKEKYKFIYFQVGSEGRSEGYMGKLSRFLLSPVVLTIVLIIRQPYIVHFNTSMNTKAFWRDVAYLFITFLMRRKIVYQVHGGKLPQEFSGRNKYFSRLLRWLLSLPDIIVLISKAQKDAYYNFRCPNTLEVIPNAISLEKYSDFKAKEFNGEEFNLVYIGRLENSKGISEAINAVKILRDREINNIKLSIAGSGSYEKLLRNQAISLGLEKEVKFIPPVFGEEKLRFWKKADILLFPTYQEGLPYTILESLASGTPMITTWVGGIPDAIEDGVHGLLIEPKSASAVADAITRLTNDRIRLQRMSEACLKRAQEYYSVERLSYQFSETYLSIANTK